MRIRKRLQGQSLSSSDPPAPQPPPPNADRHPEDQLPAAGVVDKHQREEELHRPAKAADLSDELPSSAAAAPLLPLSSPQGNVVECSGWGLGLGAQRGPAAGGHNHKSLENGHHHMPEAPVTKQAGERLANSIGPATPVAAVTARLRKKEGIIKDDSGGGGGLKKRRGAAVLLEGSRCSRVNGRGWRCSQPTLVGYSLCEHHLGKGRMRSAAAAAGRAGQQLGRTEHGKSAPAAVVAAAPKADVPRY